MNVLDKLPLLKRFLFYKLIYGALLAAVLSLILSLLYMATHICEKNFEWPHNLFAFMSTVFIVASIVLFFGVCKKKSELCAVWIWCALLAIGPYILVTLVYACQAIASANFWLTGAMIGGLLLLIVFGYLILVVNSYRRELVREESNDFQCSCRRCQERIPKKDAEIGGLKVLSCSCSLN